MIEVIDNVRRNDVLLAIIHDRHSKDNLDADFTSVDCLVCKYFFISNRFQNRRV